MPGGSIGHVGIWGKQIQPLQEGKNHCEDPKAGVSPALRNSKQTSGAGMSEGESGGVSGGR